MGKSAAVLLGLSIAGFVPSLAAAFDSSSAEAFLTSYSLSVPREGSRLIVCHGYGCVFRTPIGLTAEHVATLRGILAAGAASPAAERVAILRAVQWWERLVGPIAGTSKDTPSTDLDLAGTRGEQDCIDEAVTTTEVLLYLQNIGALTHHRVGAPEASGLFVMSYPHITAVIVEKATGKGWSVDPWLYANGEPAIIMPIDLWLKWAGGRGGHEGWKQLVTDEAPKEEPKKATPKARTAKPKRRDPETTATVRPSAPTAAAVPTRPVVQPN